MGAHVASAESQIPYDDIDVDVALEDLKQTIAAVFPNVRRSSTGVEVDGVGVVLEDVQGLGTIPREERDDAAPAVEKPRNQALEDLIVLGDENRLRGDAVGRAVSAHNSWALNANPAHRVRPPNR